MASTRTNNTVDPSSVASSTEHSIANNVTRVSNSNERSSLSSMDSSNRKLKSSKDVNKNEAIDVASAKEGM